MDFTLKTFKRLLTTIDRQNYVSQTFRDFIKHPAEKCVVMRHDVDRLPGNALTMAIIEREFGINSTYFFRKVKRVFDPMIIKKIVEMGHEIGYHYENLVNVGGSEEKKDRRQKEKQRSEKERSEEIQSQNPKALLESAIQDFEKNLKELRKIVPITTTCSHGSPLSRYDNKDLWKVYDYHDYGIIADLFFDVDYSKVLYLTDTGRRWDGERFNIRDRVNKETGERTQDSEVRRQEKETFSINKQINDLTGSFHSTYDIIEALENDLLPDQIMINTHPQRWTDNAIPWVKELVFQNVKNVIKKRVKEKR